MNYMALISHNAILLITLSSGVMRIHLNNGIICEVEIYQLFEYYMTL